MSDLDKEVDRSASTYKDLIGRESSSCGTDLESLGGSAPG